MTSGDPWLSCEPQLNARLLRPLLRFYEQQFGGPALRKLVAELGTTLDVLEDPDRWFSAALVLRMNRAMVRATGDEQITYKAGRALSQPAVLGLEAVVARSFSSPRGVYASLASLTSRYSRITRWEITAVDPGHVRACFVPDAADDLLFCENRRGVLESIPEVFDLPAARVVHAECLHRGAARCVYECHWQDRITWARPMLTVGALGALAAAGTWALEGAWAAIPGALALVALTTGVVLSRPRGGSLAARPAAELQDLLERNARRVQELQALQRVVEATRTILDEEQLVATVLEQLISAAGFDRALLLRVDDQRLRHARARGFGKDTGVEALDVALKPGGPGDALFANIVASGRPVLVADIPAYAAELTPGNRALLLGLGARAFVAAPIEGRGVQLGLLVVDRVGDTAEPLTLRDRDLLHAIAGAVGAALSNARLYREVQDELLINRKFSQYLPQDVVEEVRRKPEAALELGGQEEELTVMFIDVAGFTTMSAACAPEEVVRGLNAWFALADPLLAHADGIVDKRIGDGILAVFRALPGRPHPVRRAVEAALAMQTALDGDRERLARQAPAFAQMRVRHAIHHGPVVLGNLGSEARMEYTVIGDAVNTCARVEELTPAGEVWLTEDAVIAGNVDAVRVSAVVLRGRPAATGLWRVTLPPD